MGFQSKAGSNYYPTTLVLGSRASVVYNWISIAKGNYLHELLSDSFFSRRIRTTLFSLSLFLDLLLSLSFAFESGLWAWLALCFCGQVGFVHPLSFGLFCISFYSCFHELDAFAEWERLFSGQHEIIFVQITYLLILEKAFPWFSEERKITP